MSYTGNASLSHEIQQRVLSTFDHTLDLAEKGSRDEALLGCDFILRLDPLFEPARTLQERLRSGEESVEVTDLRGVVEAGVTADSATPEQEEAVAAPTVADDGDLQARLLTHLDQREFQQVLDLAKEHRRAITTNSALRQVVELATARLEAEPYVDGFLKSARQAIETGQPEQAQAHLAKARALDPSHPGIRALTGEPVLPPGVSETDTAKSPFDTLGPSFETGPPAVGATSPPAEPAASSAQPDGAAGADAFEPLGDLSLDDSLGDLSSEFFDLGAEGASQGEEASETGGFDATDLAADAGLPDTLPSILDELPSSPSEGDQRISELLEEGQGAFDRHDYQGAIDAWSRIFLIDIDHAEANRRIEIARKHKAESEREVEEVFHDGLSALEEGDLDRAKGAFARVLDLQPNHLAAREQIERIESGVAEKPAAPRIPEPQPEPPPVLEEIADEEPAAAPAAPAAISDELPSRRPAVEVPMPTAARGKARRAFLTIGSLVLVVILGGAWLLYQNWEGMFPNSTPEVSGKTAAAADPLQRAKRLHRSGQTSLALAHLRRLAPESPQYAEAQALIAQWETGAAATEAPAVPVTEAAAERRQSLIAEGLRAYEEREYLRAGNLLERASSIEPLDGSAADARRAVAERLEPLQPQIDLFRQGDWEYALPDLWRMHEADPANQDIARLIVDSYYNLGVRDLHRGQASAAINKFDEALALTPNDADLQRVQRFALAYEEQAPDLLYRIFVKYLPFR